MASARLVNTVRLVKDVEIKWDWVDSVSTLEWRTRYTLIDPLLRALGWDTGDPEMCFIEWPIWDIHGRRVYGRVDYALFDEGSVDHIAAGRVTPRVLVEAKGKQQRLDRHVNDLEKYVIAIKSSMEAGIGVLTNGREWWFYNVVFGNPIDRNSREIVDLANGAAEEVAGRLETWLSPDNWF